MPGKFRLSWCVAPQSNTERNLDIPILRYADVLLMYAETQNYLNNGPTEAAKMHYRRYVTVPELVKN